MRAKASSAVGLEHAVGSAGGVSVGRAAAAALARPAARGAAAGLAAGRADHGAGCRRTEPVHRPDARASRPRRPDRRRHPCAARDRRARVADRGPRHDRAGRLDPTRHPDRAAGRRRRADRRAVLSHRGGADAVRDRPGSGAADPARAGDPLARRAARQPADPRPAVHGRPRGRLARPDR